MVLDWERLAGEDGAWQTRYVAWILAKQTLPELPLETARQLDESVQQLAWKMQQDSGVETRLQVRSKRCLI